MRKYIPLIILFVGCYTAKKAAKDIEKAFDKHPDVVAEKASKFFPVKSDSASVVQWRKEIDSIIVQYDNIIKDTIQDVQERERIVERIKLKIKTMPPVYRLDSALIYKLTERIESANKLSEKYKGRADIYFKILICICVSGLLFWAGYLIKK